MRVDISAQRLQLNLDLVRWHVFAVFEALAVLRVSHILRGVMVLTLDHGLLLLLIEQSRAWLYVVTARLICCLGCQSLFHWRFHACWRLRLLGWVLLHHTKLDQILVDIRLRGVECSWGDLGQWSGHVDADLMVMTHVVLLCDNTLVWLCFEDLRSATVRRTSTLP